MTLHSTVTQTVSCLCYFCFHIEKSFFLIYNHDDSLNQKTQRAKDSFADDSNNYKLSLTNCVRNTIQYKFIYSRFEIITRKTLPLNLGIKLDDYI